MTRAWCRRSASQTSLRSCAPSQTQHHARCFTGAESGCSTKQSVAATLPSNQKNGGSDEYRSSSADLAGACVWTLERSRSERRPGLGGFGGGRGRGEERRGIPRGAVRRRRQSPRRALRGGIELRSEERRVGKEC